MSLELFRDWCTVVTDAAGCVEVLSNKCWLEFETRTDRRHGNTLYGYVRNPWSMSGRGGLRSLPGQSRRVRSREREFSPVLGFVDTTSLANHLFHTSMFVEEKQLLLCGLSTNMGCSAALPLSRGNKMKLVFRSVGSSSMPRSPAEQEECAEEPASIDEGHIDQEVEVLGCSAPKSQMRLPFPRQ